MRFLWHHKPQTKVHCKGWPLLHSTPPDMLFIFACESLYLTINLFLFTNIGYFLPKNYTFLVLHLFLIRFIILLALLNVAQKNLYIYIVNNLIFNLFVVTGSMDFPATVKYSSMITQHGLDTTDETMAQKYRMSQMTLNI